MSQPERDQGDDDRQAAADRITMSYPVELELPDDEDAQED